MIPLPLPFICTCDYRYFIIEYTTFQFITIGSIVNDSSYLLIEATNVDSKSKDGATYEIFQSVIAEIQRFELF